MTDHRIIGTDADLARAVELRKQGLPLRKAAAAAGVTQSRLRRALDRETKSPLPPPAMPLAAQAPLAQAAPQSVAAVTGSFSAAGGGEFLWQDVADVPSDADMRAMLAQNGADPDEFRWHVAECRWQVAPGLDDARRGSVRIKVERVADTDSLSELEDLRAVVKRDGFRCGRCAHSFTTSNAGTLFCSSRCRDSRTFSFAAEPIRHVVIADTQVRPGVATDHLIWIGQWIRDNCANTPTRIIHIGDHWDMEAASQHDAAGSLKKENLRLRGDFESGNRAFDVLDEAIGPSPLDADGLPLWDFHITFGNHEERICRYISNRPELDGLVGMDNMVTPERWERHAFLDPVELEGIRYAHYFYQQNSGRPHGGDNISTRIKNIGHSFVQGHQQGLLMGVWAGNDGHAKIGVVAGSYYQHDEGYKGPQGNDHWRGCVVLNNVADGFADPQPLSIDHLCRTYAGHPWAEHDGIEV